MLGWTTMGWAGHRHVSLHGHIWSLCTMFTAYHFSAQLMHHEECTANQHVCHFMYMNREEHSSQTINSCARRVHSVPTRMSLQFMKDESSGAYCQERYHGQPPTCHPSETATRNKQRSNMYVNSVRWTCLKPEDLVRHLYVTSTPLKSIKRIFILHSINVVDSCSNFKNVQTIRAPSLRGNLWPSLFVIPAADGLIGGHLAIRLNAMLQAEELPAPKRSAIDPRNLKNMGLSENRVYSQL
jgi:hypothetical protein